MRLNGKAAVVTGAASGIGRAVAERFAAEGAAVVAADVAEAGQETVERIRAAGGTAVFVRTDVTRESEVERLMEETVRQFGRLDVLVNSAGVTGYATVVTATDADWDRIIGVNLKGVWYCCKHAIPRMIEAGGGSIVNISSTHAFRTQPEHFPYQAAKGGLQAMTLGICVDYGRYGVRANTVCPGFVMTPLAEAFLRKFPDRRQKENAILASQPIGRFGTPEDVANAALFLASDEASFVSGACLVVDGGRSAFQKSD